MVKKVKCIKCGKEAELRLTPDLDCKGIPVCKRCKDVVNEDLVINCFIEGYFEKKYLK